MGVSRPPKMRWRGIIFGILFSLPLWALIIWAACSWAGTIRDDRGGYVVDYALKVHALKQSGEEVRITGRCASACTLYLALDNVCVGRRARFVFHAPYGGGAQHAHAYMLREYPAWVKGWIKARGGLSSRLITMPASYARKFVRGCG